MKKVRWHITYNFDQNNKEYDHTTYQCIADDVWVTTEVPKATPKQNQKGAKHNAKRKI